MALPPSDIFHPERKSLPRGKVILRVARNRHFCSPPGFWERHKLNLDFGSVWECECGKQWIWSSGYDAGWTEYYKPPTIAPLKERPTGGGDIPPPLPHTPHDLVRRGAGGGTKMRYCHE